MASLLVVAAAGFAGSAHCLGMCGGFACGIGAGPERARRRVLLRHLGYSAGRIASYVFIGALAGLLGSVLLGVDADGSVAHAVQNLHRGHAGAHTGMYLGGTAGWLQRALSVLAGALMVAMALQLLGVMRAAPASWARIGGEAFASVLRALLRSPHPAAPVALGVANGFLPCPLVFGFAALAAASGGPLAGMAIMFAFALGTLPAMLMMGAIGRFASPRVLRDGVALAGLFVLGIGLLTVVRGVAPQLLHP